MRQPFPTLFLPGLLCDRALWENQITALGGILSAQVADLTQDDSMEAMAHRALDAAPERFALAALSMGGYVAFEMLRQQSQRISGLCLISTSARPDTPEQAERRRLLMAMSREGNFKGVTPRLLPLLIHKDRLNDNRLTSAITAMAVRMGRDAFLRQQTAILNRPDNRPFLKRISCPTLVMGGAQDAITPPAIVSEIAQGIAGSELKIIEGSGHLLPLEKPDEVNELLAKWLEESVK